MAKSTQLVMLVGCLLLGHATAFLGIPPQNGRSFAAGESRAGGGQGVCRRGSSLDLRSAGVATLCMAEGGSRKPEGDGPSISSRKKKWIPRTGGDEGALARGGKGGGGSADDDWTTAKVDAPRQRMGGKGVPARSSVKTQGQKWDNVKAVAPSIRVSSGTARGRKLTSPDVYLRPMMGKVKEALFSFLREWNVLNEDSTFCDTFAGCGSVGIEALSQGAGKAVFVDYSEEACNTIRDNLEMCGFTDRSHVVKSRAETFYTNPTRALNRLGRNRFDVVSITPPYEEVVYSDLLKSVTDSEELVGDGSFVVVEYPVELGNLPATIGRMVGMKNRKYGRTMLAVYCVRPGMDLEPRPDEFESTGLKYDK